MDYFNSQCGYVSQSGKECGYWAFEGSPVNLCRDHLRLAYQWASDNLSGLTAIEHDPLHACPCCNTMSVNRTHTGRVLECEWCGYRDQISQFIPVTPRWFTEAQVGTPETQGDPVVYYLIHGSRIKIGTSVKWRQRLTGVPHDRLLALEPGDATIERHRHTMFRDERVGATEWFEESDRLWDHIIKVGEQNLQLTEHVNRYNSGRRKWAQARRPSHLG